MFLSVNIYNLVCTFFISNIYIYILYIYIYLYVQLCRLVICRVFLSYIIFLPKNYSFVRKWVSFPEEAFPRLVLWNWLLTERRMVCTKTTRVVNLTNVCFSNKILPFFFLFPRGRYWLQNTTVIAELFLVVSFLSTNRLCFYLLFCFDLLFRYVILQKMQGYWFLSSS